MGCRTRPYGPLVASIESGRGRGNGVSDRPRVRAAQAASAIPAAPATTPSTCSVRECTCGGNHNAETISAIRTNCATTQPPPLLERDEARIVEAFSLQTPDELTRRGRVDRQHHQRFSATPRAGDRHVRDVDAGLAEQ